jgi:hypothetical protein
MNQFLRKIYEDEPLYMPYSMKKKFPQAVAKVIPQNNKLIKYTWVIVLVSITRAMMSLLKKTILKSKGVTGISDTNRTDKTGRWHILVTDNTFKQIRKRFMSHLQGWILHLPDNVQDDIPIGFPAPKLYQKNNYNNDDGSSYGQDSYMSSCAQRYGSFDGASADKQFFSPPGQHRSYAAALGGGFTYCHCY